MKRFLISAFALGLAAAAPGAVYAQPDDHHDQNGPQAGQGDGNKGDQPDTDHKDQKPAGDKNANGSQMGGGAAGDATKVRDEDKNKNKHVRGATTTTTHTDTNDHAVNHDTRTDHGNDANHDNNTNNDRDNHNNRHTDARGGVHININISTYRRTVVAQRHFRGPEWRAPHDYRYRRWNLGERLPAEFFIRDFWLADFATYELVAPPDGYVWVRYGPDALLIDEDTGEVIQVVYGVFI